MIRILDISTITIEMASDLIGTSFIQARWIVFLWMSICYQMELASSSSSSSSFISRPGAIIYNRQLTVGGSSRDCTRPHIIPSRSPSQESVYTCCEGWKLQKNKCIPDVECFSISLGQDYHGFVNKTMRGRSCVPWSSNRIMPYLNASMVTTPLVDHVLALGGSNCRNPWSDRSMPWCFVEARPHSDVITWEYCDVGKPRKTCNMAKNYRVRCGQVTCNRGQICDEQTQSCGCQPGYHGPRCDRKCGRGRYGVNCRGLCACSHHEVCHHVTGTCSSSEDDSDGDDMMNPLRPYDRLPPGNGTAMCRSSCGVLSKIGCTCALDGGTCKCPGYVIALFVVSITTWITLGGVCVVCSIRRRRYKSKIEYKRDSDYCEELDSDEETELGTNSTQPTTVTTASEINISANESSLTPPPSLLPPPPPPPASSSPSSSPSLPLRPPDASKHHVRFAGSISTHFKHSPPHRDPPIPEPADSRSLESSTSSDGSHVYLNVDREDSMYSIDYSHPYEYLNQDGENGILGVNGEDPLEMSPECFLLQYMVQRQMRALNNAPHGYVNDSVAKWQDRNISKRLFPFGQVPFPMNSNTPAAVVVGAAATRGRNEAREILQAAFRRNGKPTIKPKPDVLKLVPTSKKAGPHQRLLEKSESIESESENMFINGCSLTNGTNKRNNNPDSRIDSNSNPKTISCQQLRPVIQDRAGTVPSPSKLKDEDDEGEDMFSSSDDHIYENSQIRKPCYRFAKSRSTDQLSSC